MIVASGNACSVFANLAWLGDAADMRSAAEILAAVEAKKVTREALAKALGVSQPNATRLYKPDPRTGKKRELTYDEGVKLIDRFRLAGDDQAATPKPVEGSISADLLMPIVSEIAAQAQRSGQALSARPLAQALARYLQQIGASPAIHASPDALEAVAQAVIPLPPEDTQPT